MELDDADIDALRAAVAASPDSAGVRKVLAELLLERGHAEEACAAFKEAARIAPADESLKLGLSRALQACGDATGALAILESHMHLGEPSPAGRLQYVRALLAVDRVDAAREHYRRTVAEEASLADPFLARRLGIERPELAPAGPGPGGDPPGGPRPVAFTSTGDVVELPGASAGSGDDERGDAGSLAERPTIDFADVGGMDALKEEIRVKIIAPLQHPELYRAYGKSIGGGILFYGPPGCGKTHLARATAGEVEASFFAVGLNDVLSMYIGESEQKLHALFDDARRRQPSVLFFDEVDALGASRTDMKTSAGRSVISQFLTELDGVEASNDGLLVLGATNAPWHLDSAFRRPGRFDRVIFVPPPDVTARARIFEILCRDKPRDELDVEKLARKTPDFSGADLKATVDLAIEDKLRAAVRTGTPEPLRTRDLLAAAKKVRPSTREWFATARNYVLYANQSGLYDDVRAYLELDR